MSAAVPSRAREVRRALLRGEVSCPRKCGGGLFWDMDTTWDGERDYEIKVRCDTCTHRAVGVAPLSGILDTCGKLDTGKLDAMLDATVANAVRVG